MKRRDYEIIGITPYIASLWERNFREDLTLSKDRKTGEIKGKIALTRLEALSMRIAMFKHNRNHAIVLKLRRVKTRGKHRV